MTIQDEIDFRPRCPVCGQRTESDIHANLAETVVRHYMMGQYGNLVTIDRFEREAQPYCPDSWIAHLKVSYAIYEHPIHHRVFYQVGQVWIDWNLQINESRTTTRRQLQKVLRIGLLGEPEWGDLTILFGND